MNSIAWIENHRRSLLFVAFTLALAGVFAVVSLPVGLFPVTSFPRIRVEIGSGSMPAKQMLIDVVEPLEEVARAVPGAVGVTSTTSRGSAEIFVEFPWGSDMNQALLSVDAAFAQRLPDLPQGTSYDVIQMSPNVIMPFVSYALISNKAPSAELRRLAQYQIAPLLTGIAGIRRVGVLGGETPEVQVTVSPQKLQAYGLTLSSVANAISQTNSLTAVGRIEDNDLLYLAISNNAFASVQSVGNVALRTGKDGLVRLADIATVAMGAVPQWLLVDDNGQPAVTFDVYQQDSADSLSLGKAVAARLAAFMQSQPKSIHLYKWYDQTELVRSSIGAVEEAILIGLVFAALVILAFLRNWRVTLVAIMVVPLSVMITVLLLSVLGMTFNIMTLGGLAAAIGLLIDDSVVMIEHIVRRAGVPGLEQSRTAVLLAAREFFAPAVRFEPGDDHHLCPARLSVGHHRGVFQVSVADHGRGADHLVHADRARRAAAGARHRRFRQISRPRPRARNLAQARPWPGIARAVRAPVADRGRGAGPGRGRVSRLWPCRHRLFAADGRGRLCARLPDGARHLADRDQPRAPTGRGDPPSDPYVDTYSRRTGAGLGGDLKESYQGDFFVRLKSSGPRPPIWQVMDAITSEVTSRVPGINFDTHQLLSDMIGDMVGRPQPVVIELSAKDPDVLGNVAPQVAAAIAKIPGIEPASVNDGVVPAGDALEIRVAAAPATLEGMTPAEIEGQVYHYLNGAVVTRYLGAVQAVGVRLWLDPPEQRIYRDQLGQLPIRSLDGHVFPLQTVARISFVAGQPEITRDNLAQVVAVTAQIGGGKDLGSTIAAVQQALHRPGLLPRGCLLHDRRRL